jgi:hypothetical protein
MTLVDKIFDKLKNNKIIAIAIVAATIFISVASFMDAFKSIFKGDGKTTELAADEGLIANPESPKDFYHNARFYELEGNIKKAKESYIKYFESNQDFIDPHIFYQELIKNAEGIEEAKAIYQKYLAGNPSSVLYRFLYGRLQERDSRILACKQIYESDSTYMPVIYQLAADYSSENITNLITSEKIERRKYLLRFKELNKNNSYFKYYIDKKEALAIIKYMNDRLNASLNNEQYYFDNPVSVTIYNQTPGMVSLSFTVKEVCLEIFYKVDDEDSFKSTGITDAMNTVTNTKMPNYSLSLSNLKPGKHKLDVKYTNLKNEMMGPYQVEVTVNSALDFALEQFKYNISFASVPKLIIVNDYKTGPYLTLANLPNEPICKSVTVKGFKGDNEMLVYQSGKNLTSKDIETDNTFLFQKTPKGKFTLVFKLDFIDGTSKSLKFNIEIVQDDEMHNFNGELI